MIQWYPKGMNLILRSLIFFNHTELGSLLSAAWNVPVERWVCCWTSDSKLRDSIRLVLFLYLSCTLCLPGVFLCVAKFTHAGQNQAKGILFFFYVRPVVLEFPRTEVLTEQDILASCRRLPSSFSFDSPCRWLDSRTNQFCFVLICHLFKESTKWSCPRGVA